MVEDLSPVRLIKPYYTSGKRGFSTAGRPYHPQDLPSVYIQGKIFKDTGNRMSIQTEILGQVLDLNQFFRVRLL